MQVLQKLGLKLSRAERKDFLVRAIGSAMGLFTRMDEYANGCCTTGWMGAKEETRQTALRKQKQMENIKKMASMQELLPPATESVRLLGLQLDYTWPFREHRKETGKKPRVRQTVLNKVSTAQWALQDRILTTTAHASKDAL